MRFGIGAASVTVRPPASVRVGETAEVSVDLEGGDADQEVDDLYVEVETEYEVETDDGTQMRETTLHRERLGESFTLGADEQRTETLEVPIPRETPVTLGRTEVWIEGGLDISWSLDPDDSGHVEVEPSDRMERVFDAVEQLGFDLREAKPEDKPGGLFSSGKPFVQEFEYVPRSGPYRGELDEIELIFDPTSEALNVTVEVDRKGGMLSEMTGGDESKDRLSVTDQDTDTVAEELSELIDRNM